jgi:hypothetical protein
MGTAVAERAFESNPAADLICLRKLATARTEFKCRRKPGNAVLLDVKSDCEEGEREFMRSHRSSAAASLISIGKSILLL